MNDNTKTLSTTDIFEVIDGRVNLTKLAVSKSKDIREWLRNKSTSAYIKALEEARGNCPQLNVINGVGTFGTREVAIKLAQWISPEFEVYCTSKLDELFSKGYTQSKELTRKQLLLLALEAEEQLELLQKENKQQQRVIEDQNILHGSLIKLKATETRTALKALKDDLGAEINRCVYKLFGNIESFRQRHVSAHDLYKRMTGKTYLGAKNSSYESKCDYLEFLKTQINRLESN